MDVGAVILGLFIGWFILPPLMLLASAWIRHLLLPIWPRRERFDTTWAGISPDDPRHYRYSPVLGRRAW